MHKAAAADEAPAPSIITQVASQDWMIKKNKQNKMKKLEQSKKIWISKQRLIFADQPLAPNQ